MGKPNATALRRFKSQIENEAMNKIREVNVAYPLQEIKVKRIIRNGGGRLRSSTEIRASISDEWGNTIIDEIKKESDNIINKAYFGEGELSEFLKEFSEKVFE